MAVAVLDLSDLAYIVLENVVPTLLAVAKLIELLKTAWECRPAGSGWCSTATSECRAIRAGEEVAQRLGHAVDHVVPYDRRVITAANVGEPFVAECRPVQLRAPRIGRIVDEIERLGPAVEAQPATLSADGPPAAVVGENMTESMQPMNDNPDTANTDDDQRANGW